MHFLTCYEVVAATLVAVYLSTVPPPEEFSMDDFKQTRDQLTSALGKETPDEGIETAVLFLNEIEFLLRTGSGVPQDRLRFTARFVSHAKTGLVTIQETYPVASRNGIAYFNAVFETTKEMAVFRFGSEHITLTDLICLFRDQFTYLRNGMERQAGILGIDLREKICGTLDRTITTNVGEGTSAVDSTAVHLPTDAGHGSGPIRTKVVRASRRLGPY
ncbi:hypothetical protein CYLTODRAFT_426730 [Cylindrobasidium torrendii FP15055 ss-10]|uniref:Uncharacterized protein n=1 Tax=Cylindrobasidium torrendii FP15055 ss-10 TaxID=1314674 RepID=A0A0D7AXI6_9AGAR|nr:hypothetical protein CYLTODRAFT_494473 [Cylindrobasidium torrendii FP15055 ss-10]KIY62675.1 hypothetical protein CYLTODRAFT_426730 [Cylindrobasidium torrendii FP15055 ss-10]